MADGFRVTRWRLLGLGLASLLYVLLPGLSDLAGFGEWRLLLVVPLAAAFAGALVLISFGRREVSQPLLHVSGPAVAPAAPPKWTPLFFMAQGALLTLALDGSLGERGAGLAFLGLMVGSIWFGMLRESQGQRLT